MASKKAVFFRTQFDQREPVFQNPGEPEKVLYTPQLRDDGNIDLVPSGKEDLYQAIQSHKDSCDIHVLLARYQNGDVDALSRAQGAYGDFTQMPTTYAELLNAMIAGEAYFNGLPVETRAKFDHSFEKFMLSMDDMPKWLEMMGIKPDVADGPSVLSPAPADPAPKSEVSEKEVAK